MRAEGFGCSSASEASNGPHKELPCICCIRLVEKLKVVILPYHFACTVELISGGKKAKYSYSIDELRNALISYFVLELNYLAFI